MIKQKVPKKKVITPYERLKKRILREFQKKKYIGDIIISDSEYQILIDYFREKCKAIIRSNVHISNDPLFATALVQIGIRKYDGNFWGHVAETLEIEKINAVQQSSIGNVFINTLFANNKLMLDRNERVNNILMHGFVSDHYANEMFDFLFRYYNIDLERDIERNNREMMNNLIEITQRDDNTGRTYLLVKQTANAIRVNRRGGKIRIRRLIKLIDRCFWEQITPANPVSRLSILFNIWQENSSEFRLQYNKYHNGMSGSNGKKSFSSPYIICDMKSTSFKVVLPKQLIRFEFKEGIKWNIYSNGKSWAIDIPIYQAVTGYKTEAAEFSIAPDDIFNEFQMELSCNNNRIRLFKIKADCIRFFDKDGDCLNCDSNLPRGEVYAFTNINEFPRSEALIEHESIGNLTRSCFEFEYGDIVRLPDGKPISIGKKLEEGLLSRKSIKSAYAEYDSNMIALYNAAPAVLLKVAAKRANGTLIEINGIRHRLFDKDTTVIDLGDRSGETGYIINLGDYGCLKDGIYKIFVDVPNDRTNRKWKFALINGIQYEFEDAPYLFKSKGTIKFTRELTLLPQEGIEEKNTDDNSYNFIIKPDYDYLKFNYVTDADIINLCFEIPALKWKLGDGTWNTEKPGDIWHGDFPTYIYLKCPEDKIRLYMDENIDLENTNEEQSVTYVKSRQKGIIECDMTRFKSWFGREKIVRSIFFEMPKSRVELLRVITRSIVESHILKGDYEKGRLIGEFVIIGKANYYADVLLLKNNKLLADKLPIQDGKIDFECILFSGTYKVIIYEDDDDDTGFGVINYMPIAEYIHNIINPYNIEGKSLVVKYIKKYENRNFRETLSCQYIIKDLKKIDENDRKIYKGKLTIKTGDGKSPISYDVNVHIPDLNKLQHITLTHFDGYDNIEFLYDNSRKIIVKREEEGLTRAVRYRRYECLYPDEYVFYIEFTDAKSDIENIPVPAATKSANVSNAETQESEDINKAERMDISARDTIIHNKEEKNQEMDREDEAAAAKDIDNKIDIKNKALSEIGLSMIVLNCLKRAKVFTVRDVIERRIKKPGEIRGFNRFMCKELLDRLYSIGIIIK